MQRKFLLPKTALPIVSLLLWALSSSVGAQEKRLVAMGDFFGTMRHPALARALSQEISDCLAANPGVSIVSRASLQNVMRQSGTLSVHSGNAGQLAQSGGAQVMVTGEIAEEPDNIAVTVRAFEAGTGRAIDSRHISVPAASIQQIPSQASQAIAEILRLGPHTCPNGSGNLGSLISFGEGLGLSDQGKYADAAQKFAKASQADQTFSMSLTWQKQAASTGLVSANDPLQRVRLLMLQGEYKGALEELQKARAAGAINDQAERLIRSEILMASGDTKGASVAVQSLVASGTQDPTVYVNLGRIMRAAGKVDEAISAFEKAKQLGAAQDSDLQVNLGELYQVQGDFKKSSEAFMAGGDQAFSEYNFAGALILYRRARSVNAADSKVVLAEAKTLLELGFFAEAIPLLETALKADARNPDLLSYLGRGYFLKGDRAKAAGLLKDAIQSDPQNFATNYFLGLYYRDSSEKEAPTLALKYLQAAVTLKPDHKEALIALARQYRTMGLTAQARQTYEKIKELNVDNYLLLKEIGDFFKDTGSMNEAEVLYSEAVRLNPDYLDARESLGDVYEKKGDKTKADEQRFLIQKIDPSAAMRDSAVHRQVIILIRTLPTRSKTDPPKVISNVAVVEVRLAEPTSWKQRIKRWVDRRSLRLDAVTAVIEQSLLSRYVVKYQSDFGDVLKQSGYSHDLFKIPSAISPVAKALHVEALIVVELEELAVLEETKEINYRFTLKMYDDQTPAYWGNQAEVKLPYKGFFSVNLLPLLGLTGLVVIIVGLVIWDRKVGRGDARVFILYDKKQAAGYFSLKLSRKQNDRWATRFEGGARKFSKKASFWSRAEEYMVGDVTLFKKFRPGKYFVHLFGNIADKVDKTKIVGTFSMAKPVVLKKGEEIKIEFNLVQDEAYVEVLVRFQGALLTGAQVTCKETNQTVATKADTGAGFNLKIGEYHMVAAHEDLRCNQLVRVEGLDAKEVVIEMHEANRLAAKGDFEAAAEVFLQANDEIEAARMYEKAGKLLKACRVLGEKYIREDNTEKALACFKRSEDYESMAALYQRSGDMENSYRSFGFGFMQKKEYEDAIRMFGEIKDYENLAKAFGAKGDSLNQNRAAGQFHEAKGQDLEAAGAFERGQDYARAGAAYERMGNLVKAGEMFVKGDAHERAAEMFLAGGDKTRAAMAFEKAGLLERAAQLYQGLGDTAKAPKMLVDAGKYIDAAKGFRASGLLDDALGALRRVAVNHPDFLDACDLMAQIFEEKGEVGLALQAAQRGLENVMIDESNLERFHAVGKRQESAGETAEAIKTFEKILSVNHEYKDLSHHVRTLKENVQARTVMGTSKLTGGAGAGAAPAGTRYEIIKELGRGGMGVVYQAKDKLLEREVAYKLLPDNIKDNAEALSAFLREAKSAAKLTHPNLVMVFDTGQENGNYFITMEYIEGQTLKQLLTRSPKQLRPQDMIKVALMICEGLHYAHQNKVIHRDVKPSNVMINKSRQVKIMDFGLATVMQTAALDKTLMRGTPLYMAPEMILGRGVDYRSDIYSMGVTLYEMATKKVPFSTGDVAYHQLHTPPPPPEQFNPGLPAELIAIILKAIAKKQEERFQSMGEMIAALKKLDAVLQSQTQSQPAA